MPIITLENLKRENAELRQALEQAATTNHYAQRESGSITHRGPFHNCPDRDCVYARILLGKELPNEQQ
jgi:hypothetical protein